MKSGYLVPGALLLAGSLLLVGFVALLFAGRTRGAAWYGGSAKWLKSHLPWLLASTGIILLLASSFLPWLADRPSFPLPIVLLVLLSGGELSISLASGLILAAPPLLAVLLWARGYLLMRSVNLTFLVMVLPFLWFGCCFKGAPGWGVGAFVLLAGFILVHVSTKRLLRAGKTPRISVPFLLRSVAAVVVAAYALILIGVPSIFALFTAAALLIGSTHYIFGTWLRTRRAEKKTKGGRKARDDS